MCDASKSTHIINNTQEKTKKTGIEHMSLDELYKAVEQYKSQVIFLAEINMLDETEKVQLVTKTKDLFEEINNRTSNEVSWYLLIFYYTLHEKVKKCYTQWEA